MNHLLRRAVGVAAVTVALGTPLTAAHAETQAHQDPRGDVASAQISRQAPRPGIDITSTTNSYEGRRLTLQIKTANLAKDNLGGYWLIRTPESTYYLSLYRFNGENTISFFETGPTRTAPRGVAPICDGVTVKRQAKKDSLVGTVPRSCLGGADTVRVAAQTQRETESGYQVDDARRAGYEVGADEPKFGPALDRN